MRNRTLHLLNSALLLCLLLGCAVPPPGPAPMQGRLSDEEQIRLLLDRFEEGVRNDDADTIMSLYSPTLTGEERARERSRVEQAVRSYRYSDYRLSHGAETLKLPPDALRKGRLSVEIRFWKPRGKTADDVFRFRREKGQWRLVHVGLKRPKKGDDADLRGDERERIIRLMADCNQAILSGDMDALVGVISDCVPAEERADIIEDLHDLFKFHKVQYFSSSFSRTGLEMVFGSKGSIAVPLDFMYVRHDGQRGERKVKFCFARAEEDWRLMDIRERGSKFWKAFSKIALPLLIQGARQGASFAY